MVLKKQTSGKRAPILRPNKALKMPPVIEFTHRTMKDKLPSFTGKALSVVLILTLVFMNAVS